MNRAPNSEKQQVRTTGSAVRTPLRILIPLAGAVLLLLTFASGASAFKVLSEAGEGAGKTNHPEGVAVNYETGRLYVADSENNRIDVFDSAGNFEKAFGWGVKNGAGEFQTCTTSCRKGLPGAGNGQFSKPEGIAVDNSCFQHDPPLTELTTPTCAEFDSSAGDVYVTDAGNRVQKLDPAGNFILSIGGGVDQTVPGDVCTAESGHTCGAGSPGFEEGEFLINEGGLNVGVGPGGVVLVVDNLRKQGSSPESKSRLQRFQPSGAEISPQHILSEAGDDLSALALGLAVESSGDFYVANTAATIRKYEPDGSGPIAEIPEPFEEGLGTGTGSVLALATDAADDLFAVSSATSESARVSIIEFDSAGNRLRRFGYGSFLQFSKGLAPYHSASGDIYASEPYIDGLGDGYRVLHLDFPPPGPLVFPTIPATPFVAERPACHVEALGNHKATLNAEINPEGKATTYRFEYVTQTHFEAEGFANPTETAESASIGADFTLHKAEAQASPLVPETEYRCRVVATNADGIDEGEAGAFKTLPPLEIVDTSVSEVGAETATLNAKVNPLGIPTTGYFEYVEEATYLKDIAELGPGHGFDHAKKAPDVDGGEEEISFGAGESPVAKAALASALSPATAYRYRVLATDLLIAPKTIAGPTKSFRTYASGEGALPDDRGYELVSPAQKNSAEVGMFDPESFASGLQDGVHPRIQAAAGSGEAITYTSWTSFGDADSALSSSQYLSKRTPSGWATENISPFGFLGSPVEPPYRGFTPDLSFGAFVTSEPPLTAEAQEGSQNLYLRDNQTGAIQALTIEAPQTAGEGFCTGYAGASVDGSRAFFTGRGAMAGAPVGKGFSLYEWSASEGLKLLSVLPDGTPASPASTDTFGTGTGFGAVGGNCTANRAVVAHAISADGSVAFWTYDPAVATPSATVGVWTVAVGTATSGTFAFTFQGEPTAPIDLNATAGTIQAALGSLSKIGAGNVEVTGSNPFTVTFKGALAGNKSVLEVAGSQLLARIGGTETIQLDAKPATKAGKGPAGEGRFLAATPDGSKAFFTAPGKLTSGATAGDLYRYDTNARSLTNLTPGENAPEGISVVGISEDGSYAYFTAGGALTGEEEGPTGEKALKGASNLYLWHEGEGLRFIARLASGIDSIGNFAPEAQQSRVTPDGRHLAFLSVESKALSGYDNTIVAGEHCQPESRNLGGDPRCPEAYLYDAEAGTLTCASCNPSGARPLGPTQLPGWTNPYEGPHILSDDGSKLFFESRDVLSPADQNGKRDVYEFEREGAGSCTSQSPGFNPASGGCLALISSGKSEDESYLVDASADGRDVFFSTRRSLVGWDTNENYDIYDARKGGGFPEPSEAAICEAEACKAPPAALPFASPSPGTASFQGPGNAVEKKKKKHKHKAKKHKSKAKKHKRAGQGRRAAR